jgi:hypothetical protein
MKIVALSFFLCSCISLGLFNVGSLYFCSLYALFLVACCRFPHPVVVGRFGRFPVHWPLSVDQFTSFLYVLSIAIDLFLGLDVFYSFGKPFPDHASVGLFITWLLLVYCLPVGLFPSCRSISCPMVCFLFIGLFPASQSVTYSLVNIMPVCLLPFQSVCFLFIGLFPGCIGQFPVHQYVSELSVPFPVFRLICVFPVHWSVSSFSVCLLSIKIGLFPTHQSV